MPNAPKAIGQQVVDQIHRGKNGLNPHILKVDFREALVSGKAFPKSLDRFSISLSPHWVVAVKPPNLPHLTTRVILV